MIFTIIEIIVISFFVGYGCYQWGYHKAVEKKDKLHQKEVAELKRQHKEDITILYNKINEKEQD